MRVIPVKAKTRSYGYQIQIVEGKRPSYVLSDVFFWYKYKSDAIKKCEYINSTGRI